MYVVVLQMGQVIWYLGGVIEKQGQGMCRVDGQESLQLWYSVIPARYVNVSLFRLLFSHPLYVSFRPLQSVCVH